MTLSSFKKRTKLSVVIFLLLTYGSGAYFFGFFSAKPGFFDLPNIKGASSAKYQTPIQKPEPYADTQSAAVVSTYVKLCSNTVYAFELAYPSDWFTTYNDDRQRCTFFAPFSFTVPLDTTVSFVPVKIEVISPEDWQYTLKLYENPNDYQNVISSQSLEFNGRPVQKITAQTTGRNEIPRGFVKTSFLVLDSNYPLVVSYEQLEEKEDTKKMEKITEEIVQSLKYF